MIATFLITAALAGGPYVNGACVPASTLTSIFGDSTPQRVECDAVRYGYPTSDPTIFRLDFMSRGGAATGVAFIGRTIPGSSDVRLFALYAPVIESVEGVGGCNIITRTSQSPGYIGCTFDGVLRGKSYHSEVGFIPAQRPAVPAPGTSP